MAVHSKFLVLGTEWGTIHLLDAMGNSLISKTSQSHSGFKLLLYRYQIIIIRIYQQVDKLVNCSMNELVDSLVLIF